jgi:hypothetical protein
MKPLLYSLFSLAFGLLSPGLDAQERVLGVDFNTNSAPREPTQEGFHVIRGEQDGKNGTSVSETFEGVTVTVSKKDGAPLNYRGSNARKDRVTPKGETRLAALAADLLYVTDGEITLELKGLPAGSYSFTSYHLEPFFELENMGFLRGASDTEAQTIVAELDGREMGRVTGTSLGPAGLDRVRITDRDIPRLSFVFTTDGTRPVTITLRGTSVYGGGDYPTHPDTVFVALNGFEIRTLLP